MGQEWGILGPYFGGVRYYAQETVVESRQEDVSFRPLQRVQRQRWTA